MKKDKEVLKTKKIKENTTIPIYIKLVVTKRMKIKAEQNLKERYKNVLIIYAMILLLIASFVTFTKSCTYVVYGQPAHISGESMAPTYKTGDVIYINHNITEFQRYDIISTFSSESVDQCIIKRIYGLPGETIFFNDNEVYVNGEKLDKVYFDKSSIPNYEMEEPITLQDDEYFLIGDNIEVSKDSRIYGPVKNFMIVGLVEREEK